MRKLILFLLVFVSAKVSAQVYQEMPQYGYRANRMAFDSTLQIPTVCGVPTIKSVVKYTKNGAIAYDSCNAVFYTYNPKTLTWTALTSGSADTTSLNNRINLKIDSLKRSNDSVYAYKNGTRIFQFKDSVGTTIDTTNQFVKRLTRTPGKDSIIYFVGANRFAIKDSVGGGGVPYTGATQDVDLGAFKISAQSFQVEGTNGLGHIHFKHQNSDATATGQSTVLYANSNGDLKYKNAGNYYSTLKTQQSADRVYTFQNKSYTLADSSDLSAKLNIADTSTLQSKSISSYTILANNTSATANVTAHQFRDTSGVYPSGSISWIGSTAPTGGTTHTYRLTQVGKCVTVHIALVYATNGSALTTLQLLLPPGAPTPVQPTGLTGASANMYPVNGQFASSANNSILSAASRGFLRNNTAGNGYEILLNFGTISPGQVGVTLQYWTN